jgi:thioesterase domain-containing protein/acyl carrier protein
MTTASLRRLLADESPELLRVRQVPNARTAEPARALAMLDGAGRPRTTGELRAALRRAASGAAVDPEDLWSLGEDLGYAADIFWSDAGSDGRVDVLFRRAGRTAGSLAEAILDEAVPETARALAETNDPLHEKHLRHFARALPGHLRDRLPPFMIPSAFVALDALPRAANGKLDRESLPTPEASSDPAGRESAPPRDALELRLVQVYEDVLDVRPVGVSDSFFDLGGHSLLAVRLMALLQKRLGLDVPLATLFQGPTVEKLAAFCRNGSVAKPQSIAVPLQPRGAGAPLFCIHPAGGGILHYLDLARHLGEDRPFYALHAPGLYGGTETAATVEANAAACLEAIRRVRPKGPYALGGWSFGGLVAFELAQRMRSAGETIALLALFDAVAPAPGAWSAERAPGDPAEGEEEEEEEDDASLIAWYAEDFARFFGRETPDARRPRLLTADELRRFDRDALLHYLHDIAVAVNGLPPGTGVDRIRRYIEVYRTNHRAAARYRPQGVYPGPVTVFRAAAEAADAALGWRAWVGGPLRIHDVPGTHETFIMEPNVPTLARQLRLCLDQEPGLSA